MYKFNGLATPSESESDIASWVAATPSDMAKVMVYCLHVLNKYTWLCYAPVNVVTSHFLNIS